MPSRDSRQINQLSLGNLETRSFILARCARTRDTIKRKARAHKGKVQPIALLPPVRPPGGHLLRGKKIKKTETSVYCVGGFKRLEREATTTTVQCVCGAHAHAHAINTRRIHVWSHLAACGVASLLTRPVRSALCSGEKSRHETGTLRLSAWPQ